MCAGAMSTGRGIFELFKDVPRERLVKYFPRDLFDRAGSILPSDLVEFLSHLGAQQGHWVTAPVQRIHGKTVGRLVICPDGDKAYQKLHEEPAGPVVAAAPYLTGVDHSLRLNGMLTYQEDSPQSHAYRQADNPEWKTVCALWPGPEYDGGLLKKLEGKFVVLEVNEDGVLIREAQGGEEKEAVEKFSSRPEASIPSSCPKWTKRARGILFSFRRGARS